MLSSGTPNTASGRNLVGETVRQSEADNMKCQTSRTTVRKRSKRRTQLQSPSSCRVPVDLWAQEPNLDESGAIPIALMNFVYRKVVAP